MLYIKKVETYLRKSQIIEHVKIAYGSSDMALLSMYKVHKSVNPLRTDSSCVALKWTLSFLSFQSMLTKDDQQSWIKMEVVHGKNASKCYRGLVKPVARTCYTIGRFHDGSKHFVLVGIRLWIDTDQISRALFKMRLVTRLVSFPPTINSLSIYYP